MAFLGALSCLTGVVLCLIAVCGDLLISRSSGQTVRMWHNIMANVRSIVACMGVIEGLPSSYSAHRAPPISFQTSMIHLSSPESQLYNPNATPANLSRMAAIAAKTRRTYIARHKAVQSADGGGWAHPDAYTSPMMPFGIQQGEYIIRYNIGSDPPTETYEIPDTGSNLIWPQCLPCHRCYTQNIKYFDPAKSSSYSLINCNDELYTTNPDGHCVPPDGYCHYNLRYKDESMTSGNLATETLTFADDTNPTQMAKLSNMVIGCGHYNIDRREGKETQTPLYSAPSGFYFVNVTNLMVDKERLNIPPALFSMDPNGRHGTIIDTGTTFSKFVPGAFDALVEYINTVQALLLESPIKDSDSTSALQT
ncbi:hypothetical protein CRG98_029252 [Punica granatum]|uniref:Peptidase A1 domain-containing protein n=1 Tax=Punica granatum TaxID=22663 RepID=A0A2I0J2B6_PUNGR|nr:hypothetical protein CRG98_029252 [Punica granatum]